MNRFLSPAYVSAVLLVVGGVTVLTGWHLDMDVLKTAVPGLVTMKPNTAACFLLAGLALGLLPQRGAGAIAAAALGAVTAIVGAVTAAEHLLGWNLGIDEWLYPGRDDPDAEWPGRMGLGSALAFIMSGAGVALAALARSRHVAAACGFTVLLIGTLELVSYAIEAFSQDQRWGAYPMALHTAVLLAVLGGGLLAHVLLSGDVRWVIGPRITFGLAAGAVVLIATFAATHHAVTRSERAEVWVAHTHEVLTMIGTIQAAAHAAHANLRNLALTGDRRYAEAAEQELRSLTPAVAELRSLTAHNVNLEARIDVLESLVTRRVSHGTAVIEAYRKHGTAAARVVVLRGQGQRSMDAMRDVLAQINEEKFDLLLRRRAEAAAAERLVSLVLPAGTILSLLLLGGAFLALNREAAERRRREDELGKANERLRFLGNIIDQTTQPFAACTPDGRFIRANRAFELLTGYEREELMNMNFRDLTPERWYEAENHLVVEKLIGKKESVQYEEYRRKDGSIVPIGLVADVFLDRQGNIEAIFAFVTDLTERRRTDEAIRERTEDLARSNADLEQFAYVASHDLQEPLRAVGGSVQLLEANYRGRLDERADVFIKHAVEGVQRMQALITGLLAFSRVGTRGNPFRRADISKVVDDALRNLSEAVADRDARITHGPLPTIVADAPQLTQVFQNLFANAIKFCPRRPEIKVSAQREGAAWRFSVSDNGIGIESQYADRVFKIFQRLHTRAEYPGTGIGLAMCKKIVERHEGRIWFEPNAAGGTTFHFTIPDREEASHDSKAA